MKEPAVFYVPQNSLGRRQQNKKYTISIASMNTSWLETCLTAPVSFAKFLK